MEQKRKISGNQPSHGLPVATTLGVLYNTGGAHLDIPAPATVHLYGRDEFHEWWAGRQLTNAGGNIVVLG